MCVVADSPYELKRLAGAADEVDVSSVPHELSRRVQAALRAGRARVTMLCERDGTIAWVSESVEQLLGYRPDELIGTSVFARYTPEDAAYSRAGFREAANYEHATTDQVGAVARTATVFAADGSPVTVETLPTVLLADRDVDAIMLDWTPTPDRRSLHDAIDAVVMHRPASETMAAITSLAEAFLANTAVGVVANVGGVWSALASPGDLDPAVLVDALAPPDDACWSGEFTMLAHPAVARWAGGGRTVAVRTLRSPAGALLGLMPLVRVRADRLYLVAVKADNVFDVARRLAVLTLADEHHRNDLLAAAERDPLTGLTNRAGFQRIARQVAGSDRGALVAYLDLDHFKPVNDTYGHATGDALLREVGRRLQGSLREGDLACRLGGDEFVVVCFAEWSATTAKAVERRLRRALATPAELEVDGRAVTVPIAASLGVAVGRASALGALVQQADARLYDAKRARPPLRAAG